MGSGCSCNGASGIAPLWHWPWVHLGLQCSGSGGAGARPRLWHRCGNATEAAGVVGARPPLLRGRGWLLWESSLISHWEFLFGTKSSSSSLPLPTSARPLTQPNFPTRPETIQVRVPQGPTLLPSPGVTWLSNFSGNDPAGVHSLSRWTLSQCVCHFVFIPPSNFRYPGSSWCCSIFPVWQGREPLTWLSSKTPVAGLAGAGPGAAAALVPTLVPGTLPSQKQSPYHLFFKVLYNFGFQLSYMQGYHWLFTLFLRRLAYAQGKWTLFPSIWTYLRSSSNVSRIYFSIWGLRIPWTR